jgi:hypothetical protein
MKSPMVVAIFVSLVLVAAVWVVYLNRASEKIVSAALPIAVASIVALGLSVFIFGADPPTTTQFVCAYTVVKNTKALEPKIVICKQNGEFSLLAINEIFARHPEVRNNPDDPNAIQLYHHLLQWEIVRRISMMFSKHWQTEVVSLTRYNSRFNRIEPDASSDAQILTTDNIREILKDNKFAFFTSPFDDVMPFQISVPSNTALEVSAPKDSFKQNESFGTIRLSVDKMPLLGPLYTITITTRPLATGQGSKGYKKYAGLDLQQEASLFTYLYEVKITTETSRLRSGSPMLVLYKQWVERMSNALRDQLDDERLYERNRRDGCSLTNGE